MFLNRRWGFAVGCNANVVLVVLVGVLAGCSEGAPQKQMQATYGKTGKLQLLAYDSDGNGKRDTWSHMDGGRVLRIEIDKDENGVVDRWEDYDANNHLEKVGTSRANDGKVDTWSYPPDGETMRVDVATRRDGRVTRTEFYERGMIARVLEDTDANGSVDKWEVYSNGVIRSVAFDTDGGGHPTRSWLVWLRRQRAGHGRRGRSWSGSAHLKGVRPRVQCFG